jgi:hypothetical protein
LGKFDFLDTRPIENMLRSWHRNQPADAMVKQEIHFVHEADRIRSATMQLMAKRAKDSRIVIAMFILLLCFIFGLLSSRLWMIGFSIAIVIGVLLYSIKHVLTSPRNFVGVEICMSVIDDGLHFSSPLRSGAVYWAGFREIYLLNNMWAMFFKNSDAVTFIPVDQLRMDTVEFILARLREHQVKINGNA